MTTSCIRLLLALLVASVAAPALAESEAPDAHAKGTTQTITLDGHDIRPSATTMAHADVVSFVNYSTHPVQVTFIEPSDLEKKIRCGLVHGEKAAPAAPWALFTWKDGKLVGNVPPGQFASVCSLEPGRYAFTAEIIGQRAREGSVLANKGTIEVK
jgi:hypothetical protein